MSSVRTSPTGTPQHNAIRNHHNSGRCAASKPMVGRVMHPPTTSIHAPVNRRDTQAPSAEVRKPASSATDHANSVITTSEAITVKSKVSVGCWWVCHRPSICRAGACTVVIMVPYTITIIATPHQRCDSGRCHHSFNPTPVDAQHHQAKGKATAIFMSAR